MRPESFTVCREPGGSYSVWYWNNDLQRYIELTTPETRHPSRSAANRWLAGEVRQMQKKEEIGA